MKAILPLSLALSLLAGSALAQTAPSSPATPESEPQADARAMPDHPRDMMMQDERPRPRSPVKSARFRLHVGDIDLGMTCPDDEPMRACEEFAMQILDKAAGMARH